MKVLFLTVNGCMTSLSKRGIYFDLLRKFKNEGHEVYVVSPAERRLNKNTEVIAEGRAKLLIVKTLNIQKTNIFEKSVSTIIINRVFFKAINKYFKDIKFDLIIYSTPPITFVNCITKLKKIHGAKTYLLLKDIFPQNAVDIALFSKSSIFYKYFRKKEQSLYAVSDFIGCMSQANVDYVLKHNPELSHKEIEINPNSIEPVNAVISDKVKYIERKKRNIPENATVFVYGGNLGKPQGVLFLIEVLNYFKHNKDVYFVIAGSGTEFSTVGKWFASNIPENALLYKELSKDEYDKLMRACDVGLIFLDPRFTIPNFPSRLLSYMEYKMPVIAATDPNTDIGKIITDNNFGYSCLSGDLHKMKENIYKFIKNKDLITEMGKTSHKYLLDNFTSEKSYQIIMDHFQYDENK
jgi:glycosyltransferase involved in cell wall biosynthesis